MFAELFSLSVWCLILNFVKCDDNIYMVNTKRPLHIVSDKFISFSIDPAILLTRINLSDISLQMTRHLSPAYVRIAGPSTEFVKFSETDDQSTEIDSSVTVTPSVWFAINEWFNMASLTPIFGINDDETTMGVWNPKSILPLMEMSDKFNLTCLWQLGYDCSNKTDVQYVEDLKILRHILDAFPDKKDDWKVVGSNIRECSTHHGARRTLDELRGIADYVMWESSENEIDNKKMRSEFARSLISFERNNPKVWTSGSKSRRTVTFETALQWAREVGEASKQGFDVILRQPRMHEFFIDTPVFWFSLVYKLLVGNIVLDMKSTGPETKAEAFAFCAKHQNNFIHRGAMVIMIVNQDTTGHKSQVRLGSLAKSMEVLSYILTGKSDTRSIYLNGERLKVSMLSQDKITLTPKHRRAKPLNGISLVVPPKSIGFFVLPGAKISACIQDEMPLLMEEIAEDQELPFSDEITVDLQSRLSQGISLQQMQKKFEDELKEDEKFYNTDKNGTGNQKLDDVLENLRDEYDIQASEPKLQFKIDDDTRKMILERAKLAEAQKKITESEQRLLDLGKLLLTKSSNLPKHVEEITHSSVEVFSSLSTEKPRKEVQVKEASKSQKFENILSNSPKFNRLTLPDLNNIHEHADHLKLNLGHSKNLQEHFKKALERPKTNILKKHVDEDPKVELELSSGEIKKVLADRVKTRAEKTHIRFTNDELTELMKKATERLKHDHILKHRGKRLTNLRSKRDINMKLLNEAARHQELKKERASHLKHVSEESVEAPKKLFSKQVMVNPFHKEKKEVKTNVEAQPNLPFLEPDDDSDFYFDDENSKEPLHYIHEYIPDGKKNTGTNSQRLFSELGEVKEPSKTKFPTMKARALDLSDENNFERKYMRLDEYFRNAKEVQEKFDDIDFSDESDYDNSDSNEKLTRLKRERSKNNCSCKHAEQNKPGSCGCSNHLGKEMKELFQTLVTKMNEDNNKNKIKDELKKESKVKREAIIYPNYKPLSTYHKKWYPRDILSLQRNIISPSKLRFPRIINDLPRYEHLLHGNNLKRSIKDNEILDQSGDSVMNKIEKDKYTKSDPDYKDFELVFPNKNKVEYKKYNGTSTLIFEHEAVTESVNSTSSTSKMTNGTEGHDKASSFLTRNHRKLTNIQKIPKEHKSAFHEMFHQLSSIMCKIGSRLKNYFHDLIK